MTLPEKIKLYEEYDRIAKEAEAIKKELRPEILAGLAEQGKTALHTGTHTIAVADRTRETLNRKLIEAKYGDVSDCLKVTHYQELRIQAVVQSSNAA